MILRSSMLASQGTVVEWPRPWTVLPTEGGLDTLRGKGLIERAREVPYPKLQAALAAAKGS